MFSSGYMEVKGGGVLEIMELMEGTELMKNESNIGSFGGQFKQELRP